MWQHEIGIRLPSTSVDKSKLQSCKSIKMEFNVHKRYSQKEAGSQEETVVGVADTQSTSSPNSVETDCSAVLYNSSDEVRQFIYPFRKRLPPPKGGYRCELCDYRTNRLSNFKRHQRCHTGDFFRCYLCPRRFSEKLKLSYHLQGHRGELVCKYCNKVFASRQGHVRHEKACQLKRGISCSCKK